MSQHIVCFEGRRFGIQHPVWNEFRKLGEFDLHETRPPSREGIIGAIQGASVLVTDDIGIDAAMLEELPTLRLISVWGTGYDAATVALRRQGCLRVIQDQRSSSLPRTPDNPG